jgi:NAD+ diphosphatase
MDGSALPLDLKAGFTGATVDRADPVRHDPEALAAAIADPRARLLALAGLDPVVAADGGFTWVGMHEAPDGAQLILLGMEDGAPRFAAFAGRPPQGPARSIIFRMIDTAPRADIALYAAARALIDWHARHGFCANCGATTALFRAGWGRRCDTCDTEHFPRVDPVVIMLAEHRGRVLIGRQPGFPPGRYSALAGFVEPGEAFEEAVARDLWEEAGVTATRVRYIASQPWPFPSSLMIACIAEVADDALTIDHHELEDARWVTRDEVTAGMAEAEGAVFLAPPAYAIAHTLFEAWLAETG